MNIVDIYSETASLKATAKIAGISEQKVRKTLLTAGVVPENPRTVEVMDLHKQGKSIADIAENALAIRRHRKKNALSD